MNWREWLTYPGEIPEAMAENLDIIESLTDMESLPEDRFSASLDFLDNARIDGIITELECNEYKFQFANNL